MNNNESSADTRDAVNCATSKAYVLSVTKTTKRGKRGNKIDNKTSILVIVPNVVAKATVRSYEANNENHLQKQRSALSGEHF